MNDDRPLFFYDVDELPPDPPQLGPLDGKALSRVTLEDYLELYREVMLTNPEARLRKVNRMMEAIDELLAALAPRPRRRRGKPRSTWGRRRRALG